MNPLDATIVRLGVYIGQLEAQNTELHRQLMEKTKDLDEAKSKDMGSKPWRDGDNLKAPPADEPFDTEVKFKKQMFGLDEAAQ